MARDGITEAQESSPLLLKPPVARRVSSSSSDSTPSSASSTFFWAPPKSWLSYIALVTALVNCLWAGSVLIFSLYAPIFNNRLGYRQMQINAVSVATEIGMYLPVPVFGFICDRYGPAKLSLLSATFFGPGYALAAATFAYRWDWKIMVAAFGFIGMGTSSMYFSGVTTCAKNFTGRRGLALALPIAAFGLSSLWQAQLVSRVFSGDVPGGLMVERVFLFFSVSLVAVGLLGGIGLKVKGEDELEQAFNEEEDEGGEGKEAWVNTDTRAFLKDRTMWWFAGGVFLVTGPGEAFINNMGTLIQTLRTAPETKSVPVDPALQVSLIALTSTLARLVAGSVSDYLAPPVPTTVLPHVPPTHKRFHCSRMYILFFFSVIMFAGFVLVGTGYIYRNPASFWIVSASIGAGYGAVFCLAPTVVSIVWGTKNFGTNWGIVTMTPALGAVVYGCLFAAEYDGHADDNGGCYGWGCSRWSFVAMTGSVAFAVLGWAWVWRGAGGWKGRQVVI